MRESHAEVQVTSEQKRPTNPQNGLKFFIFSLIGIFTFFVPITINGTFTIPLDHMVSFVRGTVPSMVPYSTLAAILLGAVHPFINKAWNKNNVYIVLSIFKVIGLIVAVMLVFDFGPSWLFNEHMGPFLFDSLVKS